MKKKHTFRSDFLEERLLEVCMLHDSALAALNKYNQTVAHTQKYYTRYITINHFLLHWLVFIPRIMISAMIWPPWWLKRPIMRRPCTKSQAGRRHCSMITERQSTLSSWQEPRFWWWNFIGHKLWCQLACWHFILPWCQYCRISRRSGEICPIKQFLLWVLPR